MADGKSEPASLCAFEADIAAIPAIPTILNVLCRVTGMGFAAVFAWTASVVGERVYGNGRHVTAARQQASSVASATGTGAGDGF